jgi:hypothetical protein
VAHIDAYAQADLDWLSHLALALEVPQVAQREARPEDRSTSR